jgi:hypothetical protein
MVKHDESTKRQKQKENSKKSEQKKKKNKHCSLLNECNK